MNNNVLNKINHLIEEFGYDHKRLPHRYFMNTTNAAIGAKGTALSLGALADNGYQMDLPEELIPLAAGGALVAGAIGGSHIIGKADKALFKGIGLDKKEDFKS